MRPADTRTRRRSSATSSGRRRRRRTRAAGVDELDAALSAVLRSEHAHFTLLWDAASANQKLLLEALAAEQPGRPFSADYRRAHDLPSASHVQRAARALVEREIVAADAGAYEIAEPFLAEWIGANILGLAREPAGPTYNSAVPLIPVARPLEEGADPGRSN